MEIPKKKEWIWEFKRQIDLLRILMFARSYSRIGINSFFYVFKNNEANYYWDKNNVEKISQDILGKILKSKNFAKNEFGKFEKTVDRIDNKIIKFKKIKWSKLSEKQLFENYYDFYKLVREIGFGAIFIRTLIYKGEPLLKEELDKIFENESHDAFSSLITSSEISFTQKEEINLLKIGNFILKNNLSLRSKQAIDKIRNHLDEYAYIPCGYFDEAPYNFLDIENRLKKIIKLNVKEIEKKLINLKNKKKLMLGQIGFIKRIKSESLKNLIESVKLGVLYKEKIRGKINEITYYTIPLFEEISKRTKLSLKEFKMLTPEELEEVLLNNKDYKKLIEQRIEHMIVIGAKGKNGKDVDIIEGKKADKKYEILSKNISSTKQENTIKGFIANQGKITGIARIIHDYNDSIDKGEILVASMTTPEYGPLMKRAGAIITDEGGITCHAAIVARELGIPCIIGTKIATKVLRNGDLVEVDANKGIVKILK